MKLQLTATGRMCEFGNDCFAAANSRTSMTAVGYFLPFMTVRFQAIQFQIELLARQNLSEKYSSYNDCKQRFFILKVCII
jgi:prophage maintenance system killer protein